MCSCVDTVKALQFLQCKSTSILRRSFNHPMKKLTVFTRIQYNLSNGILVVRDAFQPVKIIISEFGMSAETLHLYTASKHLRAPYSVLVGILLGMLFLQLDLLAVV